MLSSSSAASITLSLITLCTPHATTTAAQTTLGELTHLWRVPGSYPEGIAYDRTNKRIVLSSLISNSLTTLDAEDGMRLMTVYTPESGENPSGLGLKVDETTGYVHVAISAFGTFDDGGMAVYDLPLTDEREVVAAVELSLDMPCTDGESGCGLANGVAIGGGGVAYVTDSMMGRVFRVENGVMELVSDDLLLDWVDESFPFGSNGVVYDERGFLIVGNTGAGTLVKIDLSSGDAMNIPIDGEMGGPDGMLMDSSGRLFVITGTTVYVLEDNDDQWTSATVLGTIDIDRSNYGETATTGSWGEDNELYITFVRFSDLFGAGVNDDASLLGKITLSPYDNNLNPTPPPTDSMTSSKSSKKSSNSNTKKAKGGKSGKKL
ncbi:hypothetical protein ACHAXS_004620 [Conticribra weissflogii]